MQHRVRVGLIGLAWVFLLVMLATTFIHIAGGDQIGFNAADAANESAPSDPLGELGVAPGNPDQSDQADSATPPPAKPTPAGR